MRQPNLHTRIRIHFFRPHKIHRDLTRSNEISHDLMSSHILHFTFIWLAVGICDKKTCESSHLTTFEHEMKRRCVASCQLCVGVRHELCMMLVCPSNVIAGPKF